MRQRIEKIDSQKISIFSFSLFLSTDPKELGQELFQIRDQKDTLEAFVISTELGQVALCGHSSVKIHDLSDIKDVVAVITVDEEQGKLDSVDWTDDGQFLTIGSKSGNVHTYLAKLPQIGTALGSTVVSSETTKITRHTR